MKLWNKDIEIDKAIESFTIGNDPIYDMILAPYDVKGSLAHAKMLLSIGFLNKEEYALLTSELNNILVEIEEGKFKIDAGVEDIHSQVEFLLVERLGEVGKKIHLGRSRNDQIALDLKLYYRDFLKALKSKLIRLTNVFLDKSEDTKEYLMPGFTHSQAGMVSSFGLWYSSFAESLTDDIRLLNAVIAIVDQNPLGSAAGYGSSLPNDRWMTTQDLDFNGLLINSIYAQASRGKAELNIAFALSNIATTLNRMANDLCIYSNENYRFFKLPDHLTTGSSIMPHKKNPDVMELIRAKCNQLTALPTRINMLLANMQTGYHRDYQLLKEIVFPEMDTVNAIIDICILSIPQLKESNGIMEHKNYTFCYTVESINNLVKSGMPFRDAYHQVKEEVNSGNYSRPSQAVDHTHIGSIGNLGLAEIINKLNALSD
jgi:argininosuccinate lyase